MSPAPRSLHANSDDTEGVLRGVHMSTGHTLISKSLQFSNLYASKNSSLGHYQSKRLNILYNFPFMMSLKQIYQHI